MLPGLNAAMLLGQRRGRNIIGVAVASGATTHTRIDADGNTLTGAKYNLGGAYYAGHAAFALTQETIDSQAMIRVPAMWYRRATIVGGPHNGKEGWWVADYAAEGFTLHPAFMKSGNPIKRFWLGKYQAVNDAGTKMGSFGGTTPLVSLTISQFQTRGAARNTGGQTGWMMWSYYQLAVIQMLAMIETASTDSQAALGQGRVSQSSAANVDAADVAQASYRGIVGLWGNVYQWVDGLKTASGIINLWSRTGAKTWIGTGQSKNINGATITAMIGVAGAGYDFKDVFAPNAAAASGGTWPDLGHFTSGDYFPMVGASYGGGSGAGLWCMSCNVDASNAFAFLGSRLAKEP